jgi:hypothetical protein
VVQADPDDPDDQDDRAHRHADEARAPRPPLTRRVAADDQRGQPAGRVLQGRATDPLAVGYRQLDPRAGPRVQPVPCL